MILSRGEAVKNAVADLRLEGLAPSSGARRILEQFVQGDLTEEQLLSRALLYLAKFKTKTIPVTCSVCHKGIMECTCSDGYI